MQRQSVTTTTATTTTATTPTATTPTATTPTATTPILQHHSINTNYYKINNNTNNTAPDKTEVTRYGSDWTQEGGHRCNQICF